MAKINTAYIGLGSNLGNRGKYIKSAVDALTQNKNIKLINTSDIIETESLGQKNQPKFLNAVAKIETALPPEKLHKEMLNIENSLQRKRTKKWAPRTIDLDLLLFGDKIINTPDLKVPHPQMHLRSFVLETLCRLDKNLQHPTLKESVSVLAERLNGCDFKLNPDTPQLISVAGVIGVGKTTLTKKIAQSLNCRKILEPYAKNPFLPKVYAGQVELSLNAQLFFLIHRAEQLNPTALSPPQIAVSDYIFQKELIYAEKTLDEQQLELYRKVYPCFARKVTKPTLVIYLKDSPRNCLGRIHKRNRPYEQKIKLDFLKSLDDQYEKLFSIWKTSPLLTLTFPQLNAEERNGCKQLLNCVKHYILI